MLGCVLSTVKVVISETGILSRVSNCGPIRSDSGSEMGINNSKSFDLGRSSMTHRQPVEKCFWRVANVYESRTDRPFMGRPTNWNRKGGHSEMN